MITPPQTTNPFTDLKPRFNQGAEHKMLPYIDLIWVNLLEGSEFNLTFKVVDPTWVTRTSTFWQSWVDKKKEEMALLMISCKTMLMLILCQAKLEKKEKESSWWLNVCFFVNFTSVSAPKYYWSEVVCLTSPYKLGWRTGLLSFETCQSSFFIEIIFRKQTNWSGQPLTRVNEFKYFYDKHTLFHIIFVLVFLSVHHCQV